MKIKKEENENTCPGFQRCELSKVFQLPNTCPKPAVVEASVTSTYRDESWSLSWKPGASVGPSYAEIPLRPTLSPAFVTTDGLIL